MVARAEPARSLRKPSGGAETNARFCAGRNPGPYPARPKNRPSGDPVLGAAAAARSAKRSAAPVAQAQTPA